MCKVTPKIVMIMICRMKIQPVVSEVTDTWTCFLQIIENFFMFWVAYRYLFLLRIMKIFFIFLDQTHTYTHVSSYVTVHIIFHVSSSTSFS